VRIALVVAAALLCAMPMAACKEEPTAPQARSTERRTEPLPVEQTWRGEGSVIEFSAWHMSCPGCTGTVEEALGALDGVESVTASHETDVVQVTLKDGAQRETVIAKIPQVLAETPKKFEVVEGAP